MTNEIVAIPGNRKLIVKSNYLVNAEYNLSPIEMKIIYLMAMQVKKGDEDFKTYRMRIRDFQDIVGVDSDALYVRMEEIVQRLMKRIVRVRHDNGDLDQFPFLARASHKNKKGIIELKFAPDLKPHLIDLKERFTSFYDYNVLSLKSTHSMRIYELLKQYEKIGYRVEKVARIKQMLGIETKYRSYNYFKKRVIEQAQKDLTNHCDISFVFSEIKEGRKVDSIKFVIKRQKKIEFFNNRHWNPDEEHQALVSQMIEMGITEKEAAAFVREYSKAELEEKIQYTKDRFKEGKIRNSGAYLKTLIIDEVEVVSPIEKELAESELEKKTKQEEIKRQREREKVLLEQFTAEYDAFRENLTNNLVENANEQDWKDFISYAKKNSYVRSRLFKNGEIDLKNKDTQFWFRVFIADERLPERDQDFIEWVAQQKGYYIQGDEGNFRITGKQRSLF
ncbi:replication initiation protein [Chondrinema litorale]|uniref:replication initiation protein n=1 Tax=Chondrinema litorale TaxID=2994555 RepID=UPI0025433C50|nr:replication initiation protein [Chondrinema litorale]UZR99922.1 replication initiation protein [Chondrinema litorale]